MKKIVLFFLLILALALPVFAEDPSVLIKAKVPSGTGTGGQGDITVGGVNIKIAYQEDGTEPSGTTWPKDPKMVTGAESKPEITADLVQGDADETGCDTLYLLVGVTGNPETETRVTVSFDAPGWYSGTSGTGDQTVTNLKLHCTTAVTVASDNGTKVSASNDGQASGSDANNKPIVITHAAGAQEKPVQAGYAKLTWGITENTVVNAGDYSTTITVRIDGDGASGVEETT